MTEITKERRHTLKIWPPFFQDVLEGRKNFEVRMNDRDYRVGDVLDLREYDPTTNIYSGRSVERSVVYMLPNSAMPVFLPPGMAILGLSNTAYVDREKAKSYAAGLMKALEIGYTSGGPDHFAIEAELHRVEQQGDFGTLYAKWDVDREVERALEECERIAADNCCWITRNAIRALLAARKEQSK